jgi:hypothetical protein
MAKELHLPGRLGYDLIRNNLGQAAAIPSVFGWE